MCTKCWELLPNHGATFLHLHALRTLPASAGHLLLLVSSMELSFHMYHSVANYDSTHL